MADFGRWRRNPDPDDELEQLRREAIEARKEAEAKRARAAHGDILPEAREAAEEGETRAAVVYAELGRKLNDPSLGRQEGVAGRRAYRRRLKASRFFLVDTFGQQIRGAARKRDLSAETQRLRSRRHFTLAKPRGSGVIVILLGQDEEPYKEWFLPARDLWGERKKGALGRTPPPPPPGEAPGPLNKSVLAKLLRLLADKIEKG